MSKESPTRPRARDLGLRIGVLEPGARNAITDVPDVRVGHVAIIQGDGALTPGSGPIRTGVTAIVPHGGNLFTEKVTAAAEVINGFGKSVGLPQIAELGNIETPILLTNTLNAWRAADALVDYVSARNPGAYSFNPVVGECNDSALNDILGRHVRAEHVLAAIDGATREETAEGCVGAGVGMTGFGWKAGIGTASRRIPEGVGGTTLGALVLTNTGSPGDLRIDGAPVGRSLRPEQFAPAVEGSIIIIIATDAPLCARQLGRVARRAAFGLARTGAIASHGSGDFVIAFSTGAPIPATGEQPPAANQPVAETKLSTLFRATIESVEEAIVNSILRAQTVVGRDGNRRTAIPIEELVELLKTHGTVPR